MTGTKSAFDTLGVSTDASDREIRRAYTRLAKKHHPDVGGDGETFSVITDAFDAIETAPLRARYLRDQRATKPAMPPDDDGAPSWAATTTDLHGDGPAQKSGTGTTGVQGAFDPSRIAAFEIKSWTPTLKEKIVLSLSAVSGLWLIAAFAFGAAGPWWLIVLIVGGLAFTNASRGWAGFEVLPRLFVLACALGFFVLGGLLAAQLSNATASGADSGRDRALVLLVGAGIALLWLLFFIRATTDTIFDAFNRAARAYKDALTRGDVPEGTRRYFISPTTAATVHDNRTYVTGTVFDPLTFTPHGDPVQLVIDHPVAVHHDRWLVVDAARGHTTDGELALLISNGHALRQLHHNTVVDGRSRLRAPAPAA